MIHLAEDSCRLRPSPNFAGELHDHCKLRPLLVFGKNIAFLRRGKAALRREAELFELSKFRRFVDPWLDSGLFLERPALRGYKPQHDDLVPLGQKPQGLEAAGTFGVVFKEI